ncbi:MAG: hypothetical protein EPO06_03815 [Burkholderiaceae bacterium]|nr:MAG: hypothetical protein EPO06_03815 [Burkholderiaceae bacterium]
MSFLFYRGCVPYDPSETPAIWRAATNKYQPQPTEGKIKSLQDEESGLRQIPMWPFEIRLASNRDSRSKYDGDRAA